MSNPPSIPSNTNLITELDVATAALLAASQVEELELNGVKSLTPEVARALGRFQGDGLSLLQLNGIESLTPEVARELGQFQGRGLCLRGLTSMPADVAEELLPIAHKLGIGRLTYGDEISVEHLLGDELDPRMAQLLMDCAPLGWPVSYTIPEHTYIGPQAAANLASSDNKDLTLILCSIKKFNPEVLRSLSRCRALLRLPNLEHMTELQARELAEGNVSMEVEASTDMTTEAVRELVRSRGRIVFGATDMLQRHAAAFSEAHCDLRIASGEPIGEYAAEQLAIAKCPVIYLKLETLDGKVALALSQSSAGRLTLHCRILSDDAAAALARFSGVIGLPHLEHLGSTPGHVALAAKFAQQFAMDSNWFPIQSLGREAARAIAETPAPSMQLGLKVLSPEVAVELSRFTGDLTMLALECLSAEVSAALAHGKMKALVVGCKSMGCDVAHIWACHGLAALTLCLSPDTVTVDVVNALASGKPMRLQLVGDSISALVVDAALSSPQLAVWFHGFKELHGWPSAVHKDSSWGYFLESVSVVGDNPGLARVSGIGFTPRFPRLKELKVNKCPTIKEVDFRGAAGASPVQDPPLRIEVTHCERLENLTILTERCCAQNLNLAALPKCQEVHIEVPDLVDLGVLENIANIETLGLYRSPALKSLAGVQSMARLRNLRIVDCPQIEHIDELEGLRRLENLHIEDCPGMAFLEVAAKLPSLTVLTLRGKTGIGSLRCLRERDDVTVNIECGDIGVPPAIVKNAYQYEGADCLGQFKHALVECYQCGGQQFRGSCHGWYARIGGVVVSRSAVLDGGNYLAAAQSLFVSLESDVQSNGLEDAEEDTAFERFPVLHAEVACVTCNAIFDPASFGADSSPEMGGNWSEVGEARSGGESIRRQTHLDVDFSVALKKAERPVPEAGKCPICCEADLQLSISGRAKIETAGKFSGHVAIDRTPWSDLPYCFHVDEGDEKADGIWEWSRMPRASKHMKISCENLCFESPVSAPEQVPHVLLASLAMYESHRAQPDLDLLAGWIGGMAKTAGKPEKLVLGAVAHIDNIDPECVPRASESADPKKAALDLCTKAKALLDRALALAQKPKTRERARPQAKPKKQQGVGEGPLAGRVFCFTGRLEGMSRTEAEDKVKSLGAATADSITKKVTDVVVGEDAGSKRARALEMGLKVHDQEAFEALLRGLA